MDDERISSALGYTAHLVCMLAKYLQIPLRYQVIYNASRCDVVPSNGVVGLVGSSFVFFRLVSSRLSSHLHGGETDSFLDAFAGQAPTSILPAYPFRCHIVLCGILHCEAG